MLRAQWCRSLTAALYFSTTAMSVFATYAVYFRTQRGQKLSVGDVTSLVALLNALRQIVSFGCAYFAMAGADSASFPNFSEVQVASTASTRCYTAVAPS